MENKLHALRLTAARCLKERTHKALLLLTTSTTLSFVCSVQKNNCSRSWIILQIENLKRYIEFILVYILYKVSTSLLGFVFFFVLSSHKQVDGGKGFSLATPHFTKKLIYNLIESVKAFRLLTKIITKRSETDAHCHFI